MEGYKCGLFTLPADRTLSAIDDHKGETVEIRDAQLCLKNCARKSETIF